MARSCDCLSTTFRYSQRFEALRLPQVNADRHFLAADIEFHGLAVAHLLLLLRTQFDVVHLLHVLQLLFQPYFGHTAVDDGFGLRVELEVLSGLFAVHIHGLLDDFAFFEAFRFLFSQAESLVAFRFKNCPDGIGHQGRVAQPVCHQLEFERQRDGVAVLCADGDLHEGRDLAGEQLFLHLLRQKVGLLLVDAQHRQLPVGQRFG